MEIERNGNEIAITVFKKPFKVIANFNDELTEYAKDDFILESTFGTHVLNLLKTYDYDNDDDSIYDVIELYEKLQEIYKMYRQEKFSK